MKEKLSPVNTPSHLPSISGESLVPHVMSPGDDDFEKVTGPAEWRGDGHCGHALVRRLSCPLKPQAGPKPLGSWFLICNLGWSFFLLLGFYEDEMRYGSSVCVGQGHC